MPCIVHDFFVQFCQASDDLGPGVQEKELISHSVRVNVFRSIEFLLNYSEPLRELVKSGTLELT